MPKIRNLRMCLIDCSHNGLYEQLEEDYKQARELYAAAENRFPGVALYSAGLGYCLGKLGLYEDALARAQRADELDPDNYLHLNDLGWTFHEAGYPDRAEEALKKSIAFVPEDYEFARNNLKIVRDALRKRRKRNNALKPPTE